MLDVKKASGFTLIELMVTMAVFGILMALAAPDFGVWVQNNRIRSVAESAMTGIQLARSEAVKRNNAVEFELLSSGTNIWRVIDVNSGAEVASAPRADIPVTLQTASSVKGTKGVIISGDAGASFPTTLSNVNLKVTFNGFGQVRANADASASITQLNFSLPIATLSEQSAKYMRINVSGGIIRMCETKMGANQPFKQCQ